MGNSTTIRYDKVVHVEPKHVALYRKGEKLRIYEPGTPHAERKQYEIVHINFITGEIKLIEVKK